MWLPVSCCDSGPFVLGPGQSTTCASCSAQVLTDDASQDYVHSYISGTHSVKTTQFLCR